MGNKRIKGIIGIIGLVLMLWFDVVFGIVFDYMYGVFMGVIKIFLFKWFFLF